jgi:cytidylate kinase
MSFLSSTPVPTPSPTIDPALVTPGTAGWIVVALLALAVVLLAVDMLRRVRRVKYREEINEALDAEQSAAEDGDVSPR